MNARASQIEAIRALGYNEQEAHFLCLVAIHSGRPTGFQQKRQGLAEGRITNAKTCSKDRREVVRG